MKRLTTIVIYRKGKRVEIPVETKLKAAITLRLTSKYKFELAKR